MMQSFASMGWTTVLWWAFGFSMCFSGDLKSGTDIAGIIGNFDWSFLRGVSLSTPSPTNDTIPLIVFFGYQMMFAIITPALITGAFANRVRFPAYMLFLTAWLVLVYFPFVHMIWGGGIMAKYGVLDFAGGIVVHNIAGIAALASVLYVGRRKVTDSGPHSIPLVALGTGLLWFGWYGFNAGSEFRVDSVTAVAFVNTDLAASFAGIAWLAMDWLTSKKPKFLGLLTGAVAGLATITPAAGYVSPKAAVAIGILAGIVCFYAVALKNRLHWDDALDVWGVHGVGGFLGIRLLRRLRQHGVQSRGRERPAQWQPALLPRAARRGLHFVRVGVRLHIRHALDHRPRHAGESRRSGPDTGARRGTAWGDGLHRSDLIVGSPRMKSRRNEPGRREGLAPAVDRDSLPTTRALRA